MQEIEHRAVGGGAKPADHREDLVAQHELVRHLAGVGGVVGVVLVEVLDGAAVDAALGVDEVEVRLGAGGDLAVAGRGDSREREVGTHGHRVGGDAGLRTACLRVTSPARPTCRQHHRHGQSGEYRP